MDIKEQINSDIKDAMKAREKETVETLRFLMAALKDFEVNNQKREVGISDEEAIAVIQSSAKKRRDSIEQFLAAGRDDLVEKERSGLAIISRYLPKQMDEEEVRAIVQTAVAQCGATGAKDMGAVMKILMPQVKGKADGGLVNRIVKEVLG
ncbi:GatB/YqeY domain-containing protein [Chrysiogenes arsenatis]|uniref:GatB/YqeY domain-containing protein n=1 Tax=Chrysiogenes arsenatis TaxID=309797 RepID=UPI000426D7A7|nr:GatB/YqeY domain-containing protein [Chrysiogenes arsenatis]